jgi:hypothetical protein
VDVINIDRGLNTASVLMEMLSKARPEWTLNNSHTHYHPWEVCLEKHLISPIENNFDQ